MNYIKKIIKNETVFCISFILAVFSAFIVRPDKAYLGYTDYKTIALLFCLMIIVAGLQYYGVFKMTAQFLIRKTGSIKSLSAVMVLICFFSSMLITNDVALITFVPFTLFIFQSAGSVNQVIRLVVLETIAANLGSMATPIGNPQNLYLYSTAKLTAAEFLMAVLPYAGLSLIMLILAVFMGKYDSRDMITENHEWFGMNSGKNEQIESNFVRGSLIRIISLFALLILCIMVVLQVITYIPVLIIVMISILIINRRLYLSVDYFLLFTFICFFIFIGNMKRIPEVTEILVSLVSGRELFVGILTSQVISNVPAAILLSGFSKDFSALITGVNIGGLGTLIASMASLISFKFFAAQYRDRKGEYLKSFTLWNIIFLIALILEAVIIRTLQ